jgi:hypothetical protein
VAEARRIESGHRFNLPWLSRSGRQHGEEVNVVVPPPASQLGAVADDTADPLADQQPAADGVVLHQLADPVRERHVDVQRPVGVSRRVVGGRRVGGPSGYKMVAGTLEPERRIPVGSRVSPRPPVVPSNGRAPEVGRRGPTAIGDPRRLPRTSIAARPGTGSVTPFEDDLRSTPTAAPPRASGAARCPLG